MNYEYNIIENHSEETPPEKNEVVNTPPEPVKKKSKLLPTLILIMLAAIGGFYFANTRKKEEPQVEVEVFELSREKMIITPDTKYSLEIDNKGSKLEDFSFDTSDKSVIEIDNEGNIKSKSEGAAIVTVTNNKISKNITITVKKFEIEELNYINKETTIKVDETIKPIIVINNDNAYIADLTYTSSDTDVATVDSKGYVKGLKEGTTTITASVDEDIYAECTVRVASNAVSINSISIDEKEFVLKKGESKTLKVRINPDNATNKKVGWISDNTDILSINEIGEVKALELGTATLYAKTANGKIAKCTVKVEKNTENNSNPDKPNTPSEEEEPEDPDEENDPDGIKIKTIKIIAPKDTLQREESIELSTEIVPSFATNQKIKWSVNDDSMATIDKYGNLTAKRGGTVTVTAKATDGSKVTDSIEITIEKNDYIYFVKNNPDVGDTTVLESNGKFAFIDVHSANQCEDLKAFIDEKNIKELEFILITHMHEDHVGCIPELVAKDGLNIKKIIYKSLNEFTNDHERSVDLLNTITNAAKTKNITVEEIANNKNFSLENFKLYVYNANSQRVTESLKSSKFYKAGDWILQGKKYHANGYDEDVESIILTIQTNGHTVLIPGDVYQGQKDFDQRKTELIAFFETIVSGIKQVEIYKTSNHGLSVNNPESVLDIIRPKYYIITNNSKEIESVNQLDETIKTKYKSSSLWTMDGTIKFDLSKKDIICSQNNEENSCTIS